MNASTTDAAAPPAPSRPAVKRGRALAGGVALPLLLLVAVALSLLVGASGTLGGADFGALLESRGDRTVVGVVVGAAVALCGTCLQGVTRNPLADPGILGINAGAALAVVIGITWFGLSNLMGYIGFAIVGAFIAAAAVTMLATFGARGLGRGDSGPLSMALAGLVFTAGATSVAQAVLVANAKSLDTYRFWQAGSVGGRQAADLLPVVPFFVIGAGVILLSGRRLDILAMGDSVARGLGERPERLRLILGGASVLLAAAATGVAGPIVFVGLVSPHLLRPLIGTSYRVLVPASAFVGATLVVLGDTLGRVVSPPGEVQVGIMTAVLGCPALLWIVARMRSL